MFPGRQGSLVRALPSPTHAGGSGGNASIAMPSPNRDIRAVGDHLSRLLQDESAMIARLRALAADRHGSHASSSRLLSNAASMAGTSDFHLAVVSNTSDTAVPDEATSIGFSRSGETSGLSIGSTSTVEPSTALANANSTISTRWNERLQTILDDTTLTMHDKREKANHCLDAFAAFAAREVNTFLEYYLSETPSDADKITWATTEQRIAGETLKVTMLETPGAARLENRSRALFLAQQVFLCPGGRPFVTTFPRALVACRGRIALVSAELPWAGPSMSADRCPELRAALEAVGASLNLAPYRVASADGSEEDGVGYGPPKATARVCRDGRLYVETLGSLMPGLACARGTALGPQHLIRLRPEMVASAPEPLSPAAFIVFGTRDSAAAAAAVRAHTATVCGSAVPTVARQLAASLPSPDAISRLLHNSGLNVAMLGAVLAQCGSIPTVQTAALRRLLIAEMAARAARDVIRAAMQSRIDEDGIFGAASELFAAVCNDEDLPRAWGDQLAPVLRTKFPGLATLVVPFPSYGELDRVTWLARTRDLLGITFAKGVTASGSSAFHFCIQAVRPIVRSFALPPFRVASVVVDARTTAASFTPALRCSSRGVAALVARVAFFASGADPRRGATDFLQARASASGGTTTAAYATALFEAGMAVLRAGDPEAASALLDRSVGVFVELKARTPLFVHALANAERGFLSVESGHFGDAVRAMNAAVTQLRALQAARVRGCDDAALQPAAGGAGGAGGGAGGGSDVGDSGPGDSPRSMRLSLSHSHVLLGGAAAAANNDRGGGNNNNTNANNPTNSRGSFANASVGACDSTVASVAAGASAAGGVYAVPAMERLATLYEQKGLLEEAEPLFRAVLAVARHTCGSVDRRVSAALSNLAVNLFNQQQFEEAEEAFSEDLAVSEKLYGPESAEVAAAVGNVAAVLDVLKRSEEAAPLFERDLAITLKTLGETHNNTATSRNNLGACWMKLGRIEDARVQFERALTIRRGNLGADHPSVAEILMNVGTLKLKGGDPLGAKATFVEALGIYERSVGRTHHSLKRVLEHLESVSQSMGNDDESEQYSDWLMELKQADNDIYTAQQAAVASKAKK